MNALVTHAVLWAMVGWASEIIFTGVVRAVKTRDLSLVGHSYIWMAPVYGLGGLFMERLHSLFISTGVPLPLRLLSYLTVIYSFEFAYGAFLRWAVGKCPWDYGNARFSVLGLIRLDYAPAWLLAGVVFEQVKGALGG